jgi:RNA polymerase sigma factor (sigma-70 family)
LEDLIQEVQLYLIEIGPSILGPDYPQRIVDAIRVGSDLKAEVALRGAYLAAAGRLGDKQAKRFQRGQAQEQPLDHDVESRPSLPPETDILDDSIDLAHALTKLDDRELLVWTLSFKGHTLREIAELLSVSFQTVHRILVSVVKKLTAVLNTEA